MSRTSWTALASVLAFASCAIPAHAACARWDLSGDWGAVQNNGYQPRFVLRHTPQGLQGNAAHVVDGGVTTYLLVVQKGNPARVIRASVDGTLRGNSIELTAYWNNGTVGVYNGTINAQGRIQGTTVDRMNPRSMATWYSDRPMRCAVTASRPGTPIKRIGKRPQAN